MRSWRCVPLLAAALTHGLGQNTRPPAFDAASIKPTAHGRNAEGLSISSDPASPSPERFEVINNSLQELIRWAFHVQEYQVSGPSWLNLDSECFDIEARMPPGTSNEQLRLMLQTLLRDRFRMTSHRETRMLPVQELVVAKSAPRLEPAKPDAKTGIGYEGRFWSKMRSASTTMADLADFLSDRMGHRVIDKTGIGTRFSFDLEYRSHDDDTARPDLPEALREKLGVRLQTAKGPVEILVIDHMEKMPAAN